MKPEWARCVPRYVTTYAIAMLLLPVLVILLVPGSTLYRPDLIVECEHGYPFTYLYRSSDFEPMYPGVPGNDGYLAWDLRSDITQFRPGMLIANLAILGAIFTGLVALAEHARRRWRPQSLQFGIRSLVAATVLCSIGWWYGHGLVARRHNIAAIQSVAGVTFDRGGPDWLRELLGAHCEWLVDTPQTVAIDLGSDRPAPVWNELPAFPGAFVMVTFTKTLEEEPTEIPAEAMAWIARTSPRALWLYDGRLPASGLSALSGGPLETIHLHGVELSDNDVEVLISLPQLESFVYRGMPPEPQHARLQEALGLRYTWDKH